jgi:DUF4097 and DUF4098 domain-containing protein YvlB
MQEFHTPSPITVDVEVGAGIVRLVASDRDDTVVEVRPRDESRPADVRAAEKARVDFHNGTLTVKSEMRGFPFPRSGSVDVDIALPTGSRLRAAVASAAVQADGPYSDCRLASASGDMTVESVTGNIKADSASGDFTVQKAAGAVAVSTASGDATIGDLAGDLKFQTASGQLSVNRLRGNISAQSASGGVSVATAVKGSVSAQTASGEVEVGIAEGTAAQLDLHTRSGFVSNTLQSADGPAKGDETLVVHARTWSGDISIRRAATSVVS